MEYLFFGMAVLVVASALGVVVLRSPLHSALCLILNLITVAGLFAQLEAHFLATAQVLVYAGAVMVLVLFVIMLLNIKVERQRGSDVALSVVAGLLAIGFIAVVAPLLQRAFTTLGLTIAPVTGTVKSVGELLYTRYVFSFEMASMLIIGALVGAVMLARRGGASVVSPSTSSQVKERA